tara:strand:+ start:43151 stop:43912 length:762 start_codon:yes stop_codon:yes gene_type:complete
MEKWRTHLLEDLMKKYNRALFLHGFMGSPSEGDFLKSYALDLYCPNLSEIDSDQKLHQFFNELYKYDPEIIYGYSMGARVTLRYLSSHILNKSLCKVVLESGALFDLTEEQKQARILKDKSRAKAISTNFGSFLRKWYRLPMWGELDPLVREEWITQRLAEFSDPIKKEAMIRSLLFFSPGQFSHRMKLEKWPRNILGLYLYGEKDQAYKDRAQSASKLRTPIQFWETSNLGHNLHAQAPLWPSKELNLFIAP